MTYLYHIVITVCLYVILGLSLNLVVGFAGMLSLCHAAFYGLGAYVSTLLMMKCGWPFVPSLIAAVLVTAFLAYLMAVPSVRFQGDSFVLTSLGFQMIVYSLLYNWTDLTNGSYGIAGIPRPYLFGWRLTSPGAFAGLALLAALLIWLIARRVAVSPYGRSLQAIRDDPLASSALGKNTTRARRSAFSVAGAIAAIAGALYACYASYIDATSFGLDESVFILCVVVIGGTGNTRGPITGALLTVLVPEALRLISIPDSIAAQVRQLLYGLLLLLMMRYRPQGIAGNYALD